MNARHDAVQERSTRLASPIIVGHGRWGCPMPITLRPTLYLFLGRLVTLV